MSRVWLILEEQGNPADWKTHNEGEERVIYCVFAMTADLAEAQLSLPRFSGRSDAVEQHLGGLKMKAQAGDAG